MMRQLLCCTLVVLLTAVSVRASSPTLARIEPRGAQRGSEVEVLFHGARLDNAQEIFIYSEGFTVQSIENVNANVVKARIAIAADAKLGEHCMRLRTAGGITELRNFYVGPYPTVSEVEPNNDFNAPQAIALNSTVEGVITNEDVDYYIVEAKKGDLISAEVEGIRLGVMFDPFVAILDMDRFELAACDDSTLFLQDPFVSIIAPEDGKYIIMVRESAYGGNENCRYRLHVGQFPRPKAIYPAGGQAGQTIAVKLIGDPTGTFEQTLTLPPEPNAAFSVFAEHDGHISPSPLRFRVSAFPDVHEEEPNNARDKATKASMTPPLAFNGVIGESGDQDWLAFEAKKGQVLDIHVWARRLRSPLDPVLTLFGPDNNRIESNDDTGGPDSYLRFTAPADGEYRILIRDHLRAGGPDFVYRVEITPVTPQLALTLPEFVQFSQERQVIAVPKGNRMATVVRAARRNFGGDLILGIENLPEGITMHTDAMKANVTEVPVVFEATDEAAIGGTLAHLWGRHYENETIRGNYEQQVRLVLGEPNNTLYYAPVIDRLAVAVTEPAPFKLRIVEPKAPIVRNGPMNLKVVAERAEGFNRPITLSLGYTPPGIAGAGSVTIGEGATEAEYLINADGNAPPGTWPIVVLGRADAGKGPVWTSTQLAHIEIATQFVTLSMEMAAAERGKEAQVVCKLDQHTEFEGEAVIELLGLPPKTATQPMKITSSDEQVIFTVSTEADAPVGQHKSLFCRLTIMKNGEPVVHNIGHGGVLRIDPPPTAPKQEVAKAQPAPQPAAPQAKPLSRLEKLRLEAAQQQGGQ